MDRINVYTDEGQLAGWFDRDAATHISADPQGGGGRPRTHLYRTAQGRWAVHRYDGWDGADPGSGEYLTDEQTRELLTIWRADDAVQEHFGQVEEERGPGRPEVGPAINVRFPADLLARVDAQAEREQLSRAEMIRRLVDRCLTDGSGR